MAAEEELAVYLYKDVKIEEEDARKYAKKKFVQQKLRTIGQGSWRFFFN
jgi:hypothetical protein